MTRRVGCGRSQANPWHLMEEVAEMVCAREAGHTGRLGGTVPRMEGSWALKSLIAKQFSSPFLDSREGKVLDVYHPGGPGHNRPSSLSVSPRETECLSVLCSPAVCDPRAHDSGRVIFLSFGCRRAGHTQMRRHPRHSSPEPRVPASVSLAFSLLLSLRNAYASCNMTECSGERIQAS